MPDIPVFLTNVTATGAEHDGRGEFMCTMQSVEVQAVGSRLEAAIIQQPPVSVAGERPSQMSPWIMPTWTYDLAQHSEFTESLRTLGVGDEIILGNRATNFVAVRIEEVLDVALLHNRTGTTVVTASGQTGLGTTGANAVQDNTYGLMYYIDFPEGSPVLNRPEISIYHIILADCLQEQATDRGWDVQFTGLGRTREGNRVYWFVRVNINGTNAGPVASPDFGRGILFTLLQDARAGFGYPPSGFITTQPEVVQFDNAYRHLPPNGSCYFGGDGSNPLIVRGRFYGATGSQSFGFGTWLRDWKSGFGLANRVYRVSEPLNLNTFTPTYATKLAGKAQTAIYTTDVRGIANDLAPFEAADRPFLTLSTQSEAADLMRDSGREYHEKFLWPAYRQRRGLPTGAGSPDSDLELHLQNTGRKPRAIRLLSYSLGAPSAYSSVVVRIDGVEGEIQSNNTTINGAFAVLRLAYFSFANKSLVGDSIRSDDRPIASAPVDTTLRQLRVRFFDMSGHELKNNLMVSMWFSLLTDNYFLMCLVQSAMFNTGFGAFGTPGSLSTTIVGSPVITDISTDLGAEALALAQSNLANKAEQSALTALAATVAGKAEQTATTSALALKADPSTVTALTATVAGKAEQTATTNALALKADTSTVTALAATVSAIDGFDQTAFDSALALKADKLRWTYIGHC
jgi:hypothetical protein